jgi:hypothetical protein
MESCGIGSVPFFGESWEGLAVADRGRRWARDVLQLDTAIMMLDATPSREAWAVAVCCWASHV